MTFDVNSGAEYRMAEYLSKVGDVLGNKRRRTSFAIYAKGLMGDGERKSAEPIAARACETPALANAYHQRLTYFLSESEWNDVPVRRFAAQCALEAMTKWERVSTWIIDETVFPKQGTHSVGVQRQYADTLGKISNCQIGVSLSLATRLEHVPIDFELYLPQCWSDDPVRRIEAHIPDDVGFQTRPELAMQMIRRALAHGVPVGVVLVELPYGDSSAFRREMRDRGLDYAAGVRAATTVWPVDASGERYDEPLSLDKVGHAMKAQFSKVSWREGCRGKLWSRFASCRVRPVDCLAGGADDEELWLLMEMLPGETAPSKFWLVTLPKRATKEQLVRLVKQRHRTDRVYEDLKGELGLDHFEGRTYRGWHHHVTVALVCFAFIVAERIRRLSSGRRGEDDHPMTTTRPLLPILDQSANGLAPHCHDLVAQRSARERA